MAGAGSAAVSGAGTPVAGPAGRDLFAEGLLEFLRPAVQQLDSHVHAVRESQVELREQIDNLASELCRINEDQKVALDLDPYVKKLLNARRRVVLVNNILQNAQGDAGLLETTSEQWPSSISTRERGQDTHQIEIKWDMWHKGPEPKTRKTVQLIHHRNQVT
uniref:Biogenesis of lysosome-related organelles complex 1 subunit 7 n=2 Tax=Equus TaxID=9789 RepID=A0A9L0RW85_HORSE